jgi:uncharacterized membrane protein
MSLALTFHILAAIIRIGGMFFAHVVLRPSVGTLDLPPRPELHEVRGKLRTDQDRYPRGWLMTTIALDVEVHLGVHWLLKVPFSNLDH